MQVMPTNVSRIDYINQHINDLKNKYHNSPKYSYQEVFDASMEYFNGDDLAADTFISKYALQDEEFNYLELTPKDMHWRIANELARIESNKFIEPYTAEEIYEDLKHFEKLIPQGSPMYGIGNPYKIISLSNCFVIDSPEDSYAGIMQTDQELVQISKRRGGVGFSIDTLRPDKSATKNASNTATGAVSFMERFSHSTREVGQEGRRGALMLTMSVHYPNILDFLSIKSDLTKVTGANVSSCLTDDFMQAVLNEQNYALKFPVNSDNVVQEISAQSVWDTIIFNAWNSAEPGLLFWDTILKESIPSCYRDFGFLDISTNPCSELIMCPYDSCRLFLANVFSFVKNPFTPEAYFDYEEFYSYSIKLQRYMDNMIDLEIERILLIIDKIENDPETNEVKATELNLWRKIYDKCVNGRRTGSGVTAVGDTLAALNISYDSDLGIETSEKIYETLKLGCYRSSVDMAKELGSFPIWDYTLEKNNPFLLRIKESCPDLYADMKIFGRRNIALLTTAPTGSVSILAQTSGGIEPEFSIQPYTRRRKISADNQNLSVDFIDKNGDCWHEFDVIKPKLKVWMEVTGETDIEKSPWFGNCAPDINWLQRIKLQAAAQKHVCHSISSTINLPKSATQDEVSEIYLEAYKRGCKGITVYRDGCRDGVLVNKSTKVDGIIKTDAPKRPKELDCDVYHLMVKGQEYFVMVSMLDDEPYECFAGLNGFVSKKIKKGTIKKIKRGKYQATLDDGTIIDNLNDHISDEEAAITRLISLSLRHGCDVLHCVKTLENVPGDMHNFGRCVGRALKKYIPDGTKTTGQHCNSCDSNELERREGCVICKNCGWTACN